MRFGELFAGIGGFGLGFERAGMVAAWQVEIDETCCRVLERHWPKVERLHDVRSVRGNELQPVDLICGGFPCQDLSVAGRREGLVGERSGLWFEFHRILAESRPRWVVVENVPGLLSSNDGRDFAAVIHGLVELGYGVAWRVFDAQFFGVAQRRRRVFIVGSLGDGRAAEVLFESESGGGHSPESGETGARVAASLTAGSHGAGSNGPGRRREDDENLVVGTVRQRGYPDHVGDEDKLIVAATLQSQHSQLQVETNYITHSLTRRADSSEDGTGRGVPLVARTLTAGYARTTDNAMSHTPNVVAERVGVRRLTAVECERLQGFPDGWTEGHADSARYRMLGNAVAVPCAEWLGRRIMGVR
jgi:DNA (cytosine-5)-methyltransferase 1